MPKPIQQSGGRMMAEINIIPLVDVSLVLLIIFMVTTAFVKESGLRMELPKASTTEAAPERAKDISIAITRAGDIYVDGKPCAEPDLAGKLESMAGAGGTRRIIIKADRGTEYGRVIRVIDVAKVTGYGKFALATVLPEMGSSYR
jgi:biopolymer transport protein ExbD